MSEKLRLDRKFGFHKTFYTKCLYALIESIGPSIILRSICCWYTLELPHGGNSNVYLQHMSIQLMSAFHHKTGFHELLNYFFMFWSNEYAEMNKFLRSLACTWTTIIDSHFYLLTAYL